MKKISVIMNTNEVGGAERSLVYQLKTNESGHFTFYLPKLTNEKKLEQFLNEEGFTDIRYYTYPSALYKISRSDLRFSFSVFRDVFHLIFDNSDFAGLNASDIVYLNGNKAAFLFIVKNRWLNFRGTVIWHLRDYYHSSKLLNFCWKILNNLKKDELKFVCNSQSVKRSLALSPFHQYPVDVIYNPVGSRLCLRDSTRPLTTIGFVSMMAPWKGLHEIVLWAGLYEKELRSLGIQQIKVYGSDIYKTKGNTQSYFEQVVKLGEKFPSSLIEYAGNKRPEDIFAEIDCLIHYSLSPEPFGRVIIEAFEAGIPVISTCTGGAAELVEGQVTGLKVHPHDKQGLFMAVEQLVQNKTRRLKIINSGFEKAKVIQKNISKDMRKILELGEAS